MSELPERAARDITALCTGVTLFAKNLQATAAFYREVFRLREVRSDEDHVVLDCGNLELTLHQVPGPIGRQITIASPPERRNLSPYKLSFRVDNIGRVREAAARTGGMFDAGPPAWVVDEQKICTGHDPEGNVVEARED